MHQYEALAPDQLDAIDFINQRSDTLLCADVGCGKTVIAMTAADKALEEQVATRVLVLAPLMVADDVWSSEVTEWAHLKHLDVAIATGSPKERLAAINSDAELVVLNYENLSWLLRTFPRVRNKSSLPFDGLICDEIDFLKDISTKRFKNFRAQIKQFNFRLGMTGTVVPNHLLELWGQVYTIDAGATFGKSYTKFKEKYFYPIDYGQYNWAPFPDSYDQILQRLKGLAYRLKAVGLPPAVFTEPVREPMPPALRGLYDELEKEYILTLRDNDDTPRIIDAGGRAIVQGKLQQMCAGFSYIDPIACGHCGSKEVGMHPLRRGLFVCRSCEKNVAKDSIWHSKVKFDRLDVLRGKLQRADKQLLIFYHYTEERDELLRRDPHLMTLYGKSRKESKRIIAAWNAGEIRELALHPFSAGHGLNMQKSGAHHLAFLTIPWSGGKLKQVIGRLARRGQVAAQIFIHTFLFSNTIDDRVIENAMTRLGDLEIFLDDLGEVLDDKAA